jgi:hypothetical protein
MDYIGVHEKRLIPVGEVDPEIISIKELPRNKRSKSLVLTAWPDHVVPFAMELAWAEVDSC